MYYNDIYSIWIWYRFAYGFLEVELCII